MGRETMVTKKTNGWNEVRPNYRRGDTRMVCTLLPPFRPLQRLMRTVALTIVTVLGSFTGTHPDRFGGFLFENNRLEWRALMGAVAERLIGRKTTGTPGISLAGNEFDPNGTGARLFRFIHKS